MANKHKMMHKIRIPALTISLVFILLLSFGACTVKYQKEKIWHLQDKVVDLAKTLIGSVYRYGGNDIDGFDCSGYVWYVYDCYGITVPRTAKKQKNAGRKISKNKGLPGDIVVFRINGRYHTGILLSKNKFSHSPKKGSKIRVEEINKYWSKRLVRFVRVID